MKNLQGDLTILAESASNYNAWFTPLQTKNALVSIGNSLNETDLNTWLNKDFIALKHGDKIKNIGLVLAGNIPLVGFHDVLCVLASGNAALIKLSSQDQKLIPFLLNKLVEIEPAFVGKFAFIDRLKDFDAVIATGSNNTSRYFEYYFAKVPHIIRKNRNSVALLSGAETASEFTALGHDIFDYFGLGCRNVSKLYAPVNYKFDSFFEGIESFKAVGDHHKFNNNYDYNKSIYLVNGDDHLDNGFLLLKRDVRLASPLAVLYFEEYMDIDDLKSKLNEIEDQVQCVVTNQNIDIKTQQVAFGKSQQPALWDYADGINTMQFLNSLQHN